VPAWTGNRPADGISLHAIIGAADTRMYAVKSDGAAVARAEISCAAEVWGEHLTKSEKLSVCYILFTKTWVN